MSAFIKSSRSNSGNTGKLTGCFRPKVEVGVQEKPRRSGVFLVLQQIGSYPISLFLSGPLLQLNSATLGFISVGDVRRDGVTAYAYPLSIVIHVGLRGGAVGGERHSCHHRQGYNISYQYSFHFVSPVLFLLWRRQSV